MKTNISLFIMCSLSFISSCSQDNPLTSGSRFIDEGGGCYFGGLVIDFRDSVSDEFALAFLDSLILIGRRNAHGD